MADDVIRETRERLSARLEELRPAVEEAAKIEAALAALKNGPRPPVTALDMLKPVPDGNGGSQA
jgi:CheY-like chemotaxis protein